MTLLTRVSRLFRADLNAVLDRLEEPQALLRQAMHDMQDDLACERRRARQAEQRLAMLRDRAHALQASVAELDEQLDLCIHSQKDELAKSLVRRKLETEQMLLAIAAQQKTLAIELAEMTERIAEHAAQLQALQQKIDMLNPGAASDDLDRKQSAYADRELAVPDHAVEVALLREKQKRSS